MKNFSIILRAEKRIVIPFLAFSDLLDYNIWANGYYFASNRDQFPYTYSYEGNTKKSGPVFNKKKYLSLFKNTIKLNEIKLNMNLAITE